MNEIERAHFYRVVSGTRNAAGDLIAFGLKDACSQLEWTTEAGIKIPAKAIGKRQWDEAYTLVMLLDRLIPGLPEPTPGADPKGFICLTWRSRSGIEFALEIHADQTRMPYAWTVLKDGFKTAFSSAHGPRQAGMVFPPRPLIESLRAALGETAKQRKALPMTPTHDSEDA